MHYKVVGKVWHPQIIYSKDESPKLS